MKSYNLVFLHFLFILIVFDSLRNCVGDNVKKSVDENRDDNGDIAEDSKDESLEIPPETNEQPPSGSAQGNATCTRRANTLMHEVRAALPKQFPFIASVMSQQNEHLCTGTVVSNGLILTTAQCTQQPISYLLLNATKGKKDETTVPLHVIKTEKFPTFNTVDSGKDVGLIYTEKHNNTFSVKLKLSNFTSSRNVSDMEVIGFGLNAEVGQIRKLQYIGLENRMVLYHYGDMRDILHGYIDCIDTKVPTCFRDTGGPSIFNNELIGIVIAGDNICFKEITSTYAVNKKVVDVLPTYTFKAWLEEKIKKNEEQDLASLVTFPKNPAPGRRAMSPIRRDNSGSSGGSPIHCCFIAVTLSWMIITLC